MSDLSIPEQLARSTTRIECRDKSNGLRSGTGFFYTFRDGTPRAIPTIVTNKHVVDESYFGKITITSGKNGKPVSGGSFVNEWSHFSREWIFHPDPEVDLCAMPIGHLIQKAINAKSELFFRTFNDSNLPNPSESADFCGLEKVIMVGYPIGLWDSFNNLPLFREGIVSSDYNFDWEGKKQFLIDIASFPGSSGSPVLIYDSTQYQTRKGIHLGSGRLHLIGILYAGPTTTAKGEIVMEPIPLHQRPISQTQMMINLGLVVKSTELMRLGAEVAKAVD